MAGRFGPSVVLAVVLAGPSAARALDVYALAAGANANQLVRFDSATPGTITGPTAVTGLQPGDTLVGIDFRPATRELIGLGVNGNTTRLYRIDPVSFVAGLIGQATVNTIAGATAYGIDFNPTVDRLRVVNNLASDGMGGNANNFRLNPENGALAVIDPDLDFSGLTGGAGAAPEVALAYSNSTAGATTTVLRGLVSGGDQLVTNGGAAPGFPTLATVGALGVNISTNAGFDVAGDPEQGFAIMEVGGLSLFYVVNLTTGAAAFVSTVGTGTLDFAGMSIRTRAPIQDLADGACGRSPFQAALFAANGANTPDGPPEACDALCRKWTAVCRKFAGTLKTCWQNVGKQAAAARKLRCTVLGRADKKACTATIKAEQAELKTFLADDLDAATQYCLGSGLSTCLAFCN